MSNSIREVMLEIMAEADERLRSSCDFHAQFANERHEGRRQVARIVLDLLDAEPGVHPEVTPPGLRPN